MKPPLSVAANRGFAGDGSADAIVTLIRVEQARRLPGS